MNDACRQAIEAEAEACYPRECVGYIVREPNGLLKVVSCPNVAESPETSALIAPETAFAALLSGRIEGTYHSHPNESSKPSNQDLAACEETQVPMYIFSYPEKMWSRVIPEDFDFPLEGREFVFGIQDCYDLAREYFRPLGIELGNVSRHDGFWNRGENICQDNYVKEGFVVVTDDLKLHDVLLFCVNCPKDIPNHGGIYVGNNQLLHHLHGRLSRTEALAGAWSRRIHSRLRHSSLC